MTQKILIIEDDERLAQLMSASLSKAGYQTDILIRGGGAVAHIRESKPDLLILDIMLPDCNGFSICQEVREFYTQPILMVTALGGDDDHVEGLEAGADGYLVKPVRLPVLHARVKSLLRRTGVTTEEEEETSSLIELGALRIDQTRRNVFIGDDLMDISTAEFELLLLLANNAGAVMSRDDLCQELRGISYDGIDRSIDMRVSKLRQKLKTYEGVPIRIKTVHGHGYLLVTE